MDVDEYVAARNALAKDLIAFDGHLFQVLSLPEKPAVDAPRLLRTAEDMAGRDPASVYLTLKEALQ